MKNIFYTFLSMLFAFSASAQLINDGASIIVEDGATLFIEGSLQNNLTGSIDIQGTGIVEVEGDVTNAGTATITMSTTAKLILSGANASNFTSGGATITNLEMDKTVNTVALLDQMRISTNLNFVGNDNQILIGNNNLVFAPLSTITSADANEYIVADGAANMGVVSKELSANEIFKFEIGDATNYTPLNADVMATGYAAATLNVNVVGADQPNKPAEATDYISRYWNVDAAGITALDAELTGTYVAGDLTGVAGDTKGAHYGSTSTDWTYTDAAAGTNEVIGSIAESGDFTGTNAFGRANLKIMLDGAFSGGTMSNTLNTMDLLPTTSPYGGGETVAAGFFAANTDIVDWVSFETRNTATPATVEGIGVGFVKTDGSVVALDGTSNPFLKNASTTGYVVIKHRNHLAVSTGASIDLNGTLVLQDFSDAGYTAFGSNGLKNNGGTMTMWAGDVNADGTVLDNASPSDVTAISSEVLTAPGNIGFFGSGPLSNYTGLSNIYSLFDMNLDGNVYDNASPSDATNTANTILSHPLNTGFFGSGPLSNFTGVTAQIPE